MKLRYTEKHSKVENLTRSRPEFEPGQPGAEAAQPEKVERCRQVQIQWQADVVKNQFLSVFRYILAHITTYRYSKKVTNVFTRIS